MQPFRMHWRQSDTRHLHQRGRETAGTTPDRCLQAECAAIKTKEDPVVAQVEAPQEAKGPFLLKTFKVDEPQDFNNTWSTIPGPAFVEVGATIEISDSAASLANKLRCSLRQIQRILMIYRLM